MTYQTKKKRHSVNIRVQRIFFSLLAKPSTLNKYVPICRTLFIAQFFFLSFCWLNESTQKNCLLSDFLLTIETKVDSHLSVTFCVLIETESQKNGEQRSFMYNRVNGTTFHKERLSIRLNMK